MSFAGHSSVCCCLHYRPSGVRSDVHSPVVACKRRRPAIPFSRIKHHAVVLGSFCWLRCSMGVEESPSYSVCSSALGRICSSVWHDCRWHRRAVLAAVAEVQQDLQSCSTTGVYVQCPCTTLTIAASAHLPCCCCPCCAAVGVRSRLGHICPTVETVNSRMRV